MARTALDITPEEAHAYRPGSLALPISSSEQWQQAWQIARNAAHLLREQFQVTQVIVFGSLVHRETFTIYSDIDLALRGIAPRQFYRAVAAVTALSRDFEIDIVDVEDCSPNLLGHIEREGIEL